MNHKNIVKIIQLNHDCSTRINCHSQRSEKNSPFENEWAFRWILNNLSAQL